MKKILFISTRFPFPIFGGDKSRLYDLLKFLSKKNRVDLVCLGSKNQINKKKLIFCRDIKVFHLSFLSKVINSFFSLLKLQPIQNGICLSRDMKKYINSVENEYDSIVCHLLRSSQYLPDKFSGKKILEMSDLQSLAYEKLINQLSFINPVKYVYMFEKLLVSKYEKEIFSKFNNIVFVSNVDASEAKKKTMNRKKIHVIKMAKNLAFNAFKYKKNNNKIIFIGNIKFIPNKLACFDFAKNIMKKINFDHPNIKFHIIGNISFIDKYLLQNYKNVVVHGKVDNLNRVIKNSICGLCNVKISTGFQSKILSYMSYGIPVILSFDSFVNTNFKKNKNVMVFKNEDELIKNINYLIKNKKLANKLSINSQAIVKKEYNINKILSKYSKII